MNTILALCPKLGPNKENLSFDTQKIPTSGFSMISIFQIWIEWCDNATFDNGPWPHSFVHGSSYIAVGGSRERKYLIIWHQRTPPDAKSAALCLCLPLSPAPGKSSSKKSVKPRWMVGRKSKLCSFSRLWKGKQRCVRLGLIRSGAVSVPPSWP